MNVFEKIKFFPTHLKGELMSDPERNGEYRFLEKFIPTLEAGSVIFDVGANIGGYSEKIMSLQSTLKTHCFEPIPDTFKILFEKFNGNTNFVLNEFALSNENGQTTIYEYGKLNGTNSLELHPDLVGVHTQKFEIPTVTLDDYCETNQIDNIDFLKIDVEGHEVNVLQGAQNMIQNKKIGTIQLEYNFLWKNTDNRMGDVFDLLSDNYNLYRLTFWGKIHISKFNPSLESFPTAANYLAVAKAN